MRLFNYGRSFIDVEADFGDVRTFSEAFLYDKVGKGDARFILSVAEEYETLIQYLGEDKVRDILETMKAEIR